jgi:hypothetical protein
VAKPASRNRAYSPMSLGTCWRPWRPCCFTRIMRHRDKPIGGDVILDCERSQSNKSDTLDGKRPQRVAIADLNIARGRYRSLHAFINQRPALCHSGVAEAKTIMLRQFVRRFRNAVSCEIASKADKHGVNDASILLFDSRREPASAVADD